MQSIITWNTFLLYVVIVYCYCVSSVGVSMCRRPCSAWRNWSRPRCYMFLFGWVWSPHWRGARSRVTIWASCCISCCRLGASPNLSSLKGECHFLLDHASNRGTAVWFMRRWRLNDRFLSKVNFVGIIINGLVFTVARLDSFWKDK